MSFYNTKIYGMFTQTCPKCHQTKLFKSNAFDFKNALEMHDSCSVCHQDFIIEPGFYWGAMYMAYGLSSALLLSVFVICNMFLGFDITKSYFIMVGLLLVLFTTIFRFARSIWINMFISFDKENYSK